MFWITIALIVGLFIGAFIGVVVLTLVNAGKYDDMMNNRIE